MTSTCMEFRR